MPDTGAPWNIPYVDPTDLVRDYPDASEDLADAIAAGLSAAGSPGIGSNVVQVVKTNTFSTTSATYTAVTDFAATITPSTATSKILVVVYANLGAGTVGANGATFIRVTGGNAGTFVGDADGSRIRSAAENAQGSRASTLQATIYYLDNPATTSPVTYAVEMLRTLGGTSHLNRSGEDVDSTNHSRTPSSITLIEVDA